MSIKYSIVINQYSVIENKWDLYINIAHLVVLDVIVSFINSNKCNSINENNETWYWVSNKLICEQTPLLKIGEPRVRQMIKDLEKVQLLSVNPNNQNLGRLYLKIGPNYEKYIFHTSNPATNVIKAPQAKQITQKAQIITDDYESELQVLIDVFNEVMSQKVKYTIIGSIISNYGKTRQKYSTGEIQQAIMNIPNHTWWKDKMSMTILFRTSNTAKQPVDYISDMLNINQTEMQKGFHNALNNLWNE
jgi:hypothetical protein